NESGHPYGLTAAIQLAEIRRRQGDEAGRTSLLLDAYRDLRDGRWPLNLATYRFFLAEIEAAVEFPPDSAELRGRPSAFEENLAFAEFLGREVFPALGETARASRAGEERSPTRFLAGSGAQARLVSVRAIGDISPGRTYFGGYAWDLEALAKRGLSGLAFPSDGSSGRILRVIDDGGRDVQSGEPADVPDGALALSLRRYPLPWRFVFAASGLDDLKRTAARENLLYVLLLGVIGALMALGAFLLARDISREAEATRLKTEFVQTISHELKTPLTLIRLYGETLQRQPALADKERLGAYEIITKESERLSHLINNVLDFSRIEMGRKEFAFRSGDLAETVRATFESYRYHLEKKGFAIKAEIAADLPEATFDAEAVASVLVNLLSNAMKFSPGAKEVAVRLRRDGGEAVLEVEDQGVGISPSEAGRIFQKFYRIPTRTGAGSGATGSGLGLTIVKHIVEAHGGWVEVRSEPGKGSLFAVHLPLRGPGEEAG
ncbi:MAG: hypothetical protein FJY80_13505, partial [Candidatus Aminicenantes bacterium]|nr:hypothetical protein [Candidatus Aminicenantes bacterium]